MRHPLKIRGLPTLPFPSWKGGIDSNYYVRLSSPDSNQGCFFGCLTTPFSAGIIVIWIWTDNATPKVDERESGMSPTVRPQFPSTGPKPMSCPCWYTRSAFLVPTASFSPFGTLEVRFLYQWCAPVYLVHTKASSRTFSVLWNNRRLFFQVWKTMCN